MSSSLVIYFYGTGKQTYSQDQHHDAKRRITVLENANIDDEQLIFSFSNFFWPM
tara:strand:+ start:12256 stop:12417 length:162 start_codon:yes stop_codon:yes gene_type:complete